MQWLWVLLAIVLAAVAGYISWRADVKRAVPIPWLPAVLRSVTVFLVLLLLLAPLITISKHETQKPIVVYLQDDSRSVGNALAGDTAAYHKQAKDLLDKLATDNTVVTWNLDGNAERDSIFNYHNEATDISDALAKVQEYYGTQNLGAVILASDGKYNQGTNPLHQQLSFKGSLYTIGLGDTTIQKDIRISRIYANKTASLNSRFEIRADIIADMCRGYNSTIRLEENGNVLGTAPVNISGDRFDRSVSFTIKATQSGMHHYTISAPVADGETNTANNKRDVFVEVVDEQKHILIAGYAPHPDIKAIKEALRGLDNYRITTRLNNDFPTFTDDYDILILHNLPAQGFRNNPTIVRSNKPTWFILGNRSDVSSLTGMNKPTVMNFNTATMRNVFPAYSPMFNAFSLPQNIRAITDKLPPLSVPSGKIQAAPNAQILFGEKGAENTPLWVMEQSRTPTAMITGEGLWRWRLYEYKNFGNTDVVDECIRQTVAFLSVNNNDKPFRVTLPKYVWSDNEAISFNAYMLNANHEPINEPEVKLAIKDSSGNEEAYSFERSGSGYLLNIGVRAGGTYTYTASAKYNDKTLTASGSFVVEQIPLELMETGADYAMMYSLAEKNNGHFFTRSGMNAIADSIENNASIKPVIETNIESVPLIDRKWFFFLVLLFAVAEWLLRKYWLAQ